MSMIFNFYSISKENIELVKEDPLFYWLVLNDKEAFTEEKLERENIDFQEESIPKIERKTGEGTFSKFCPSYSMAFMLSLTLENHSKETSNVIETLMQRGILTSYTLGWFELRLVPPEQIKEFNQIISNLSADVIKNNFSIEQISEAKVLEPEYLKDSEKLIDILTKDLENLAETLEFCSKNNFGLTCAVL